jgi:hypothetical protein
MHLKVAPLWLRCVAGAVFMASYWTWMVLASVPLLPSGTFPRFQIPVMVVAAVLAGLLARLTVRRRSTLLLAIVTPILFVLLLFLFTLMAPPRMSTPLG